LHRMFLNDPYTLCYHGMLLMRTRQRERQSGTTSTCMRRYSCGPLRHRWSKGLGRW
jgi:hypothetical protein